MKHIIILYCLCHFLSLSYSQENKLVEEFNKTRSRFGAELNRSALKDTNEVIMFAFKVNVSRQPSGVYKVTSYEVNDSIAYTYYKNFNFLNDINYKLYAQNRKEAVFIMSVAILVHYPTKVNAGMEHIRGLDDKLMKYLFRHDKNGNQVESSQYIYMPLGIIITTTAVDYRQFE